jgi:hypothetical protein
VQEIDPDSLEPILVAAGAGAGGVPYGNPQLQPQEYDDSADDIDLDSDDSIEGGLHPQHPQQQQQYYQQSQYTQGGMAQLDEATEAIIQANGGLLTPTPPGQTVTLQDESGSTVDFPPDHPDYAQALHVHQQQILHANQNIVQTAQHQQQQAALEPPISVEDGEAFANKYMQDLGQEIEDFRVFTWPLKQYRKQDKKISSPEFECGGHKWCAEGAIDACQSG